MHLLYIYILYIIFNKTGLKNLFAFPRGVCISQTPAPIIQRAERWKFLTWLGLCEHYVSLPQSQVLDESRAVNNVISAERTPTLLICALGSQLSVLTLSPGSSECDPSPGLSPELQLGSAHLR